MKKVPKCAHHPASAKKCEKVRKIGCGTKIKDNGLCKRFHSKNIQPTANRGAVVDYLLGHSLRSVFLTCFRFTV